MKYRSVGKSGLKISEVALGSWVTDLKGTAAEDVAKETVKLAYDSGVNFFDCAVRLFWRRGRTLPRQDAEAVSA